MKTCQANGRSIHGGIQMIGNGCLKCGTEVNHKGLFYAIRKNGNKRGSKQIGLLRDLCGLALEKADTLS